MRMISRFGSLCTTLLLCAMALGMTALSAEANVSGSISYSGSKTGRVYLVLQPQGNFGQGNSLGTSVPSQGAYGIAGVPDGTYDLYVFMDTVGNGLFHASDPMAVPVPVVVNGGNGTANVTLADPPTFTPVAPDTFNAIPTPCGTFLMWDPPRDPDTQALVADSYSIYWSTSPQFTPQTAQGGKTNILANGHESFYIHNGSGTFYYLMTATSGGNVSAPSAIVGPVTIPAAPAAGNTISGKFILDKSALPGFVPTGTLYVVVTDDNGKFFFSKIVAPTFTGNQESFSVPGVANGSYFIYYFVDMNNDGVLTFGDLSDSGESPFITVNNGNLTIPDITLKAVNAATRITTYHARNGFSDSYNTDVRVEGILKQPVNVTLTGKPSNVTAQIPMGIGIDPWDGGFAHGFFSSNGKPSVGNLYTFDVTYPDSSNTGVQAAITGVVDSFSTPVSPRGFVVVPAQGEITPTLTWTAPAPALAGNYTYNLWLNQQGGNGGNNGWWVDALPAGTTFVPYNFDGNGPTLSLGTVYQWGVRVNDANGNESELQNNYTFMPVTAIPVPQITTFGPGIGAEGSTVTIFGNNFSSDPAANQVLFSDGSANTLPGTVVYADFTQLQVIVPQGAQSGPIVLKNDPAGQSVTSPATFTVTVPQPPSINSFSPSSGTVGAQVTIYGNNFNPNPGATSVKFTNNITASISSASPSQLIVTVPNGATTGPISVTTAGGTATSFSNFTVTVPISFSGFVKTSTGTPVAGATVQVVNNPSLSATSLADGSFTIPGIPPVQGFTLKATAAGFSDVYYGPQGGTSNITGRTLTFYTPAETATWGLSAGTGAITGQVIVSGGIPLQGATVNIVSPAGKYSVTYDGGGSSTGPTGAFRINGVSTSDTLLVTATKAGWTFNGQRTYIVYGNGVTEGNVAAATISYTGSLKDSAGVAVSGATVELSGYPSIKATTAADGTFTIGGLPSGNNYTLKMSKAGYFPSYSSIMNQTANTTNTASAYSLWTGAEVAGWGVTPGKGVIRSRVTDNSATPVNLAGAVVTATSALHPLTPYQVAYFDGTTYGGSSTFSNGVYVVKDVDEGDTVTVTATMTGWSFSTRTFITHADAVSMSRITGTNQPVITPSPGSLNFGSVATGTTSQSQTLTLTNTGAVTLTVTASGMTGPNPEMFIVNPGSTNPCPEQLPADLLPGQGCTLSVSFSPATAGMKNATLTINSSDPTKPVLSVPLSGTGSSAGPVISGFTPAGGPAGSTVTISGSNFDSTPGNNGVQFNGAQAAVIGAGTTQLTVIVPNNATSGPVTVSTVNGLATGASFTVTTPTSGPYTVSGTVSYAGSKTGRVYLALQGNGNYGTSVATAGSVFTIRGMQPGNYTLRAFMDTVGNGMQHGADPAVTIGNVSVTNAAIVINPTLVDPTPVTPQTPSGLNVAPGDHGAFIQWNSPKDQNGVTIADSYRVYWSTTPSFTPQSATGSTPNMPGDDNSFFIATLTNGTYYFLITAASGTNVSSPSGIVGPIVIGPPAGGTTVTVPVNIGFTPTGPLYVAVHDDASNKMFIAAVASPAASNNVAVVGVTNGTYQVHAIVDMNNDGMLDAGDVVNDSNGIGIQVTVNNAPVTAPAISLAMQNVLATVQTNHYAGPGYNGYNLNFNVRRMAKQPVAVTLAAGPASTSYPVDIALSAQSGEFFIWVPLTGTPAVGDSYTLTVTYANGTSENIPAAITGVLNTFATPVAPAGFLTGAGNTTPTFSWAAPTPAPAGTYAYSLWLSPANGGTIWNQDQMPSSQTSVLFNVDNSAQQSALALDTTYYWSIAVQDANGNTASIQTAFVPVITVPAPVINGFSNFSGNPGDTIVIFGNNFYPVPANNQVAFTSGTGTVQATVTAADMTSLTVIVPVGATTGPIRVTTAGGTATSPFAFNISQFQLTTAITGSGTVNNVNQSGPAFSCASASCVNSFSAGSSFTLHASPSGNYTFGGWSGCGSIDGNGDCLVTLNGNAAVTATFNMIPLVQVVGNSTPYQTLQEAYNGASSGAVLKARNIVYSDTGLTMNRGIAVTVKGGLLPDFTTVNGYSYLPGILTLMTGSLTAENLVVK
jgi:uncharacterized protein (DUF2141 family)